MIRRIENTHRSGREAGAYYLGYAELDGRRVAVMFTEREIRDAAERAASNPEDIPAAPADVEAVEAAIAAQAPVFPAQTAEGVYQVQVVPDPAGGLGIDYWQEGAP